MEIIELENGKRKIPVPEGIRFISEWREFSLNLFGDNPYIIDKQIPGCGFTEYCLTNDEDIILASPRKMLLGNKKDQHPDDIHYAKNTMERDPDVDGEFGNKRGLVNSDSSTENESSDPLTEKESMRESLRQYINKCYSNHKPCKIIVTYDSFKYVKEFLEDECSLGKFKIVVDEFQSIFIDSRFKASTEFEFFNLLQTLRNNICFVSATPMIDDYLSMIPYFKGMNYYELDWEMKDSGRVKKPELKVRKTKSIISDISEIIDKYLSGDFNALANPITGERVESKEAVFYLNSVNDIFKVVSKKKLNPDQVNILCSDNPQNRAKMKKKLKGFSIGKVPLRGQPHKMFTFCTRTVYLGADFYSTNARTFIFSDANIDSLSVDISMDLPQILGRQRLEENPWKNHAEFFFKTLGAGKEVSKEMFDLEIQKKTEKTNNLLGIFSEQTEIGKIEALISNFKTVIACLKYSEDYISLNNINGVLTPVFNELVRISERRAYDIQQIDYRNRFVVFDTIKKGAFSFDRINEFIDYLRDTKSGHISDRLKELCETEEFDEEQKKFIAQQVSEKFDQYYNLLGPEKCKACRFNITYMKNEIDKMAYSDIPKMLQMVHQEFKINNRYSKLYIKTKLKEIYDVCRISGSPKATDLEKYFNIKPVQILYPDKKKDNGFEILGLKTK